MESLPKVPSFSGFGLTTLALLHVYQYNASINLGLRQVLTVYPSCEISNISRKEKYISSPVYTM